MTVHCQRAGCGKSWPRDPILAVPCPDCRARAGAPCIRPSGHKASSYHRARDIAADQAGAYGRCPLGHCGLANVAARAAAEATRQGELAL